MFYFMNLARFMMPYFSGASIKYTPQGGQKVDHEAQEGRRYRLGGKERLLGTNT